MELGLYKHVRTDVLSSLHQANLHIHLSHVHRCTSRLFFPFWMLAHIFGLWQELLHRCFVVSESVWEHTRSELWVVGGKQMWIVIFATLLPAGLKISHNFNGCLKNRAFSSCTVLLLTTVSFTPEWWRRSLIPLMGLIWRKETAGIIFKKMCLFMSG